MYRNILKPIADFLFAFTLLVILSPIILMVALILALDFKGSPIFKQQRPGFKTKPFCVYKFKTMNSKKYNNGKLLPDEQRLTVIGSIVRKWSLDELPQLFNVIKGDISLIGPRPLLMKYLPLYNEFQRRRHEVKPGITGWAQVNGRNNLEWSKRFEHDVWYVDNQSFALDLRIILLTIVNILHSKDINKKGFATTDEFRGND